METNSKPQRNRFIDLIRAFACLDSIVNPLFEFVILYSISDKLNKCNKIIEFLSKYSFVYI